MATPRTVTTGASANGSPSRRTAYTLPQRFREPINSRMVGNPEVIPGSLRPATPLFTRADTNFSMTICPVQPIVMGWSGR